MYSRSSNSSEYKYGFNGKEKDDEVKGEGAQYDYGFRIYDPRLGKFLSVDPLFRSYPYYTPYQFAGNMPIWAIDLDGLEEKIVIDDGYRIEATYTATQEVIDNVDIETLTKEINNTLNANPTEYKEREIQLNLPEDRNYDKVYAKEARVQFKIKVLAEKPSDINFNDLSNSRIATKYGESLGGRIVMGELDDPEFQEDPNTGLVATAYHNGYTITLNPIYYDKNAEGYHGFGTVNNGDGTSTTYYGDPYKTITHEIGHDLGLDHEEGEYPENGNMSNKGDRVPTADEMKVINSSENENIIQPGRRK